MGAQSFMRGRGATATYPEVPALSRATWGKTMRKSLMLAVSAGTAVAAMLIPAAASAATASLATTGPAATPGTTTTAGTTATPAATTTADTTATPATTTTAGTTATPGTTPTNTLTTAPEAAASSGSDPDTAITFAVTTGLLSMTAPAALTLSSGVPGSTVSGILTPNVVTDNRGADPASWTATVLESDFTAPNNTLGGPAYTIPAADASYTPSGETSSANITLTPTTVTALSGSAQTDMAALGTGSNTASWDATIAVAIPVTGVVASYTGTMTQSVS
jgi:hypothetical protein